MICRICKKDSGAYHDDQRMLKYGVRHYAHYHCWLDKKGINSFDGLSRWKLRQFPFFSVKEAGLLPILEHAINKATC